MNQMEFEQEWLWILRHYVKPMADKVYLGYDSDVSFTFQMQLKNDESYSYGQFV